MPVPPPPPVEEVAVVASRDAWPTAVAEFRDLCFEPMRAGASGLDPEGRRGWVPLDDVSRASLAVASPGAPAWERAGDDERPTLVLSFSLTRRPDGLDEHRCILVRIGEDGADPVGGLGGMMRGPGTTRHVGVGEGVPVIADWSKRRWTAMPAKGNTAWLSTNANRRGRPASWVVVVDPGFYATYDYVVADLTLRETGEPRTAILTLTRLTRPPR